MSLQRVVSTASSVLSGTTVHLATDAANELERRHSQQLEAVTVEEAAAQPPATPATPRPMSSAESASPTASTYPIMSAIGRTSSKDSHVEVPLTAAPDLERSISTTSYHDEVPSMHEKDRSTSSDPSQVLPITASYPPAPYNDKGGFSPDSGTNVSESAFTPPDGGLRAWLTVFGGWLILFSSFGYVNAWGVYQSYFKLTIFADKSESAISWIGSVQLCLFFLMALVAGPLFDKGRFRLLVALGSAMWVVSILIIPECSEYWQSMLDQGILGGMGVGLLFLPSLSIQSHWFARRRNLAVGIVASGSSIGGIAFPIMLNKLFQNPDYGFEKGVRASGYVVLACLVAANVLMSPNPARKNIAKPPPAPFKQLFSAPYTLLAVGAMVLNFGLWFPNFYIQVYGEASGVDSNLSFYLLAIFNAASFFGRTIPNLLADYFKAPFLTQSLCCLGSGIVLWFMKLMDQPGSIVVFAILYGFLSGGFISLVSPVIVSLSRDLSEIGLRQGIAFLIVAGAAVGGNPIAGKLLADNNNDFLHPILFAAAMATAGGCIIFCGCFVLMKQRGTWRV
ncbi:hypothetical protein JCM10207_002921 [Rhodosporidiobolus poonsookiae]